MSTPRLLYVVTHPMTARYLLRGQLAAARARGYDVAVASAPGPDLDAVAAADGVPVFPVPLAREIAPLADARALAALVGVLRCWRPDVVNAGTPKAGLLGMLAARATGVPVRIYTLRGLRLETTTGRTRALLRTTEKLAAGAATRVIAVSPSLAAEVVRLGLAPEEKVTVLGHGASNGVDPARFAAPDPAAVAALRARLGLPESALVVGFVGRFTRDKGLPELVHAFRRLQRPPSAGPIKSLPPGQGELEGGGRTAPRGSESTTPVPSCPGGERRTDPPGSQATRSEPHPGVRLLLVGAPEAGDPVPPEVLAQIEDDPAILTPGFLPDPAPAYALMDVLAFPSHREGFPNVPLEAAAAGLPVVGARATGTVDAVVHGETGTLVPVADADALADALARYLADPALRQRHGGAGRRRVQAHFTHEAVWTALFDELARLLIEANLQPPRHPP